MRQTLIYNALIVNEGIQFQGSVLIEEGKIKHIFKGVVPDEIRNKSEIIDAKNNILIPGIIDDQVHFREPGLTNKGDIYTEARAAVAGGITSFMEMPNTQPQTLTQDLLEDKYQIASEKSLANYSFYMGASNNNLDELIKTNPGNVCGIKVFMGASTGNMLVDNQETLKRIFAESPTIVAVHCEDENTIRQNIEHYRKEYGEDVPIKYHPYIRSEEACYKSSSLAVELAAKYNTRLHVLHLSTARELALFQNDIPLKNKRITAEVCVHHLWFDENSYTEKGNLIKWNPAIKTSKDKVALFEAALNNKIDVIATDHAPHTQEEKKNSYFKAPSGGPLVQHSLTVMLEFYHKGLISIEKVVEKMCHAPADVFGVSKRGYIREGYQADLTLINMNNPWTVSKDNILYKCGWSPFEGTTFKSRVTHTFVNGNLVYDNGKFNDSVKGQRLLFER